MLQVLPEDAEATLMLHEQMGGMTDDQIGVLARSLFPTDGGGSEYVKHTLDALNGMTLEKLDAVPSCKQPLPEAAVLQPTSEAAFNKRLKAATQNIKDHGQRRATPSPQSSDEHHNTPVQAQAVVLDATDLLPPVDPHANVGASAQQQQSRPAFVKQTRLPSWDDTIALWTLSDDQALPFKVIARTIDSTSNAPPATPDVIRATVAGEAGTGKSQLLLACIWYAFQHDKLPYLAVASYTWRAALNISTPICPATSTTYLFGTGSSVSKRSQKAHDDVATRLRQVRIVFIDEFSFLSLEHLGDISTMTTKATRMNGETVPPGATFGNKHVVLFGDLHQHQPIMATPVYTVIDPDRPPLPSQLIQQLTRKRPQPSPASPPPSNKRPCADAIAQVCMLHAILHACNQCPHLTCINKMSYAWARSHMHEQDVTCTHMHQ